MTTLLTGQEVIKILRLDTSKRPNDALAHLRRTRQLPFLKIGKSCRYRHEDVEKFIQSRMRGLETNVIAAHNPGGKNPRRPERRMT